MILRAQVDPHLIDEVIIGSVGHTSDAYNVARVIALLAGLPVRTSAYSVQRNCSSGLQPFVNAYQNIQSEDADVQIVGGVESMSRAPFVSREMRWGKRLRHAGIHRQHLGGIDGCVLWSADGADGGNPG